MAQWLGQFMGRTHATRVADTEDALKRAAEGLREEMPEEERARKFQVIRGLAERVIAARLRMIKARIIALRADDRSDSGKRSLDRKAERGRPRRGPAESISTLCAREEQLREAGVDGVLREFGAGDASAHVGDGGR
jgi:hypothetical protein